MYVCMYVCICMRVCMYVYVCISIHIYVCIYNISGENVRGVSVLPKMGGGIVRGVIVPGVNCPGGIVRGIVLHSKAI